MIFFCINSKENNFHWTNIHWITIPKLISLLTSDRKDVIQLGRIVLLTHTTFCSSIKLLQLLNNKYFSPIPINLTKKEIIYYNDHYLRPIKIRVIGILKAWMKEHWYHDFSQNIKLQQLMIQIIIVIFRFCKELLGNKEMMLVRG